MATVPEQAAARVLRSVSSKMRPAARGHSALTAAAYDPAPIAAAAAVVRRVGRAPVARRAPRVNANARLVKGPSLRYVEGATRGLYRVFNKAGFRFYWNATRPPEPEDAYDDFAEALPHTPAQVFGDGSWFFAVEAFNGVLASGFRQLGAQGARFQRIDVETGVEVDPPPISPAFDALEVRKDGFLRVHGRYIEGNPTTRANEWVIGWGLAPVPEDTVSETVAFRATEGEEVLTHDIGPFEDGRLVYVRLQVRRGTVFSEDSTERFATASTQGPTPPRVEVG